MHIQASLYVFVFVGIFGHGDMTLERRGSGEHSSQMSHLRTSLPKNDVKSGNLIFRNVSANSILNSLMKDLPETVKVNDGIKEQLMKRQILAPGYYEAECSDKKKCPSGKYCNVPYCEDCHKEKVVCSEAIQCCEGLECTYGRCDKSSKGDPGTFCEKDSDCGDGCCVLEPTISRVHSICRPFLEEFHQCAPILFRKIWVGPKPDCGPCKKGLECAQKGIYGSHQVCMKPT